MKVPLTGATGRIGSGALLENAAIHVLAGG